MTSQAVQSARPLSGRIWPLRPRRVKNVIWEKERIILNKHAVTCSRHLAKETLDENIITKWKNGSDREKITHAQGFIIIEKRHIQQKNFVSLQEISTFAKSVLHCVYHAFYSGHDDFSFIPFHIMIYWNCFNIHHSVIY